MPRTTTNNPYGCALVKLPTKPSDLIRLALKDLIQVERSKVYDIDMAEWHLSMEDEERGVTCAVCLGGAVMARTFKTPMTESPLPKDMPYRSHNQKRLEALDQFRTGCIHMGILSINRDFAQTYLSTRYKEIFVKIEDLSVTLDYSYDRGIFKRTMRKIANLLEKMGL